MQRDSSVKPPPTFVPPLSPSEKRVLQLVSEGKTPKEIAYELKLSQKTVYAHCHSIMLKLGFKDLHSLMLFAVSRNDGKDTKVAQRKSEKQ
jgi:DNA-binding CsgD family transcriptional regulator